MVRNLAEKLENKNQKLIFLMNNKIKLDQKKNFFVEID